jgi:hypothetical protein
MSRPALTLASDAPWTGRTAVGRLQSARERGSIRPDALWPRRPAVKFLGITALTFSALYFLSDVIEVVQGGFSVGQLWLS